MTEVDSKSGENTKERRASAADKHSQKNLGMSKDEFIDYAMKTHGLSEKQAREMFDYAKDEPMQSSQNPTFNAFATASKNMDSPADSN